MLVGAEKLHKSFGAAVIFDDLSFQIQEGEKIGMVGINGAGKTTLMRILLGEEEADRGRVLYANNLRIGYLKQHTAYHEETIYEVCLKAYAPAFALEEQMAALEAEMGKLADDEQGLSRVVDQYHRCLERFEEEGGYSYASEIRGMLKGLGFSEEQFDQPASVLSGGEKSRLELASVLLGRPQLLLLDEPTNHLDMASVQHLEGFLRDFSGALLVISHDRYFLNQVAQRIFLLEHHKLYDYHCGYAEFSKRRKKDVEIQLRAYENQQKEIARQEEIIDRLSRLGGSKRDRGISQSASRQKLLDKMKRLEKPPSAVEPMSLRFEPRYSSGEDMLQVEHLGYRFADRVLFSDVSFRVQRGDRIALIGDNGAGKTTLFRLLRKELPLQEGTVRWGSGVQISVFDQEQRDLHPEKTVIDEIWDEFPHLDHFSIRAYLAKFRFIGDAIFRQIGECSGGERARVALLKLMLQGGNLLLLDEPTNHLDIESREALEDALLDFTGTMLFISHDRYFLNRMGTHLLHLKDGQVFSFLGTYEDYQNWQSRESSAEATVMNRTQQKKKDRAQKEARRLIQQQKKRIATLEEEIASLEEEKAMLLEKACDPSLYEDHEQVQALQKRLQDVEQAIDEKTEAWLEASQDEEDA